MPWPCGASNEPMTLPALSKWIIDGGRTQQSDAAELGFELEVRQVVRTVVHPDGVVLGATARPVTPPIFHLFGSGFGQPGSYMSRGACPCASATIYRTIPQRPMVKTTAFIHRL